MLCDGMSNISASSGEDHTVDAIERLNDFTVIDCDVHEVHNHLEFAEYLEEPWRSKLLQQLQTDEPLASGLIGTAAYDYVSEDESGFQKEVEMTTPDGIREFMDRMHTDYVILHGNVIDFASNIPNPEFASAFCRAYNDYMLDNYLDEYDGFKCAIRVPSQAPHRAAEEIDRLADEDDMVAVGLAAGATEPFGKAKYDPIFEAANDHGLPMDYHVGWPVPMSATRGGPVSQSSVEEFSTFNHHMMAHVSSVIFQGIPEKYPDLDHIFIEGGFTWLPHLLGRMDKAYERRTHDLPWLERRPSDYVRKNCYFGTQPIEDPAGVQNLIKVFDAIDGLDTLLYASDYPHGDFDYPSILAIPTISDEYNERIFGANALKVYDIE